MTDTAAPASIFPAINYASPGNGTATLPDASDELLAALMVQGLRSLANSIAGDRAAHTVSVSLDMTGAAFLGGEVAIQTEVDRQTRTLAFMNGSLSCGGKVLLKATAIFRLADKG